MYAVTRCLRQWMIWLFPPLALPVVDPDQIVRTKPVNRKLGFVARPDAHGSWTRYLDSVYQSLP